jgi:hypothetical protein
MRVSDRSGLFRPAQRLPKDIGCPNPYRGFEVGLGPTLVRLLGGPMQPNGEAFGRSLKRLVDNFWSELRSCSALSHSRGREVQIELSD